MRSAPRLCWGALCLGLLAGCAGHASHTLEARRALDRHDPKAALALYNKELGVGSGSELPEQLKDDTALFLLDRSTISQELEAYADSSRDLEAADKKIEMLDFSRSTADEIGKYLFSDDTGPYKARPYEKLLINTLNMLNYLVRGDLSGAKVEARRLSIMQKYLSESQDQPGASLLGPGSYLAGFVFEMARDFDEALRYYDEALKFADYATLREPIQRVAQYTGYRSPRINQVMEAGQAVPPAEDSGELLFVVGYGRVPALRAERMPIGLALTYAGLWLNPVQNQGARRLAGQGLVTWVNYPTLEAGPRDYPPPVVAFDETQLPVDVITNVDGLVHDAFEKDKGRLVAAALTRLVARGAVGAGAGVGVARASNSAELGMLAALVTQATLSAVDTPDTRCWATLPARIAVARARVPSGTHRVRLTAQGVTREHSIEVTAGGFAVVNLTELSQR